jgi:hypothetical protein
MRRTEEDVRLEEEIKERMCRERESWNYPCSAPSVGVEELYKEMPECFTGTIEG